MMAKSILVLGAAYGLLLASKLLFGNHKITLVCRPDEEQLINAEGFRVRLPVRGLVRPVDLDSRTLPGEVFATGPARVDPRDYDFVVLAMQEPQYGAPEIRALLHGIAEIALPCLSVMNMPPLPYLRRTMSLDFDGLQAAYTDPRVWDGFDPKALTHCSADPQAVRPVGARPNIIHVTLPTNFKVTPFDNERSTAILRQLERDVEAARIATPEGDLSLPVKLKLCDSVLVPLAKWPMLLTGNYRCLEAGRIVSIAEAVHKDVGRSYEIYNFVAGVCLKLGASSTDLVPFEHYSVAAKDLVRPSSAARALVNGAANIERADKLVQLVARQIGLRHQAIDDAVALVDSFLEINRKKTA